MNKFKYILWLIGIVVWNFGVLAAKHAYDVIAALFLKQIVDIDKLTESDTELNKKIDDIESSLDDLLDEYEATTHILNRMKDALEEFDDSDVDKKYDRLLELEKLYDEYQLKIDNVWYQLNAHRYVPNHHNKNNQCLTAHRGNQLHTFL